MIQYSALFYIFWNIDALITHFLDNQIMVVRTQTLSFNTMLIETRSDALAWFYYILKLDHLLCVPAMFFLYKGLYYLVEDQRAKQEMEP